MIKKFAGFLQAGSSGWQYMTHKNSAKRKVSEVLWQTLQISSYNGNSAAQNKIKEIAHTLQLTK